MRQTRHTLKFDSMFESGNLDMVVRRDEYEYDLYMRVDTNTRGHHQWFFFSCENVSPITKQVKFNIVNFTKQSSLYGNRGKEGMRINIFNVKDDEMNKCGWQKGGTNISYQRSRINKGDEYGR